MNLRGILRSVAGFVSLGGILVASSMGGAQDVPAPTNQWPSAWAHPAYMPSETGMPEATLPSSPFAFPGPPQEPAMANHPWDVPTWPAHPGPLVQPAAHVPPNAAQVHPDLNFQHFPGVPTGEYPEQLKLKMHKDAFLQRLSLTATWLDRGSTSSVGVTEVELYATGAIPWPSREQPMLITPGFNVRFFDAVLPELPSEVYDAYLQWMWLPRWNEYWSGVLAVAPGGYSDFEQYESDALRITGRGLVRWHVQPDTLEVVFGVLYLDRTDYSLLPAGGIIWSPVEHARFELLFPKPKIGWRLAQDPGVREDWIYWGGEFGGDTWLVTHGAQSERMTMRDWRTYVGAERILAGGSALRIELGYVFARTFEFESSNFEYEPDDSILVRLGGNY